jgi:glucose/arabinose dehydrogenase
MAQHPLAQHPVAIGTLALVGLLLASACSADDAAGPATSPPAASSAAPSETPPPSAAVPEPLPAATLGATVADNLGVPWGLALLPDGSALVSERSTGRVLQVRPGAAPVAVGSVPGVVAEGEGGLLGLAVAPSFAQDRLVYAYLTAARDNRVVRMAWPAGGSLGPPQVVLSGIPKGAIHNGGQLVFGPGGLLWISTGDEGVPERAQDLGSLGGKILRVSPDGSVPADNPFPGSPIWSYGHRNVQGLAFDSAGQLWASEFGAKGRDELNRIERGGNFGWPAVEGPGGAPSYLDPYASWPTSEASPSGLAIVADVAYLGALRGQRLWQVPLAGSRAGQPRAFLEGELGRIRGVLAVPGGGLWVTTSNTDGRGEPRAGDDRVAEVRLG